MAQQKSYTERRIIAELIIQKVQTKAKKHGEKIRKGKQYSMHLRNAKKNDFSDIRRVIENTIRLARAKHELKEATNMIKEKYNISSSEWNQGQDGYDYDLKPELLTENLINTIAVRETENHFNLTAKSIPTKNQLAVKLSFDNKEDFDKQVNDTVDQIFKEAMVD